MVAGAAVGRALHIAQQRAREKTFLADHGIPTAPFESPTTPTS